MQGAHHAGPLSVTADYALICTGRKPLLHTGELNQCGIEYDQQGIIVNDNQMTTREGIYAIGDVTGGVMLAHRAMQQGRAVASYLYGDHSITYREDAVPSIVYSRPAVARVGLTEAQAAQRGLEVKITRAEYASNIIARTELKGNGFVKAVFYKERLVGVTIAGDDAGELIASMALAVTNEMERKELKKWIIPHPTLSEILHIL
jgi:dihydrolipoamide dehydrogenase